jgi:hypothetical protein
MPREHCEQRASENRPEEFLVWLRQIEGLWFVA